MDLTKENLLRRFFFNRVDLVAVSVKDHIFPVYGDFKSHQYLSGLIDSHLNGGTTELLRRSKNNQTITKELGTVRLGAYTPDTNNQSKWACIDFDGGSHSVALANPWECLEKTQSILQNCGIFGYAELSGSGTGYHLWIFSSTPISATAWRKLCFKALSANIYNTISGEAVDIYSNKGIEVFPKCECLSSIDAVGNAVFLPFWYNAEGNCQFYANSREALDIEEFTCIEEYQVEEYISDFSYPQYITPQYESRPKDNSEVTEWQQWRNKVLPLLDLNKIYGDIIVDSYNGEFVEWLKARDIFSEGGDKRPSAGIATGRNGVPRGTYHSFITNNNLSVFDYIRETGVVESHIEACRYIGNSVGISCPESKSPKTYSKEERIAKTSPGSIKPEDIEAGVPREYNRPTGSELPQVQFNQRQFRDVVSDAWAALYECNTRHKQIFLYNYTLISLQKSEFGLPRISPLGEDELYGFVTRSASWMFDTRGVWQDMAPPKTIVQDMLASKHDIKEKFPKIKFITGIPTFGPNGQLVLETGHHPKSGIYYSPTLEVTSPPDSPTIQNVEDAKQLLLKDLLLDFPFVTASDLAHMLAAFILPFVRPMISGPTPIHLIEAPVAGSGKSKLCSLITILVEGHTIQARNLPSGNDEVRKMLVSELLTGKPVISLDNMSEKKKIDSAALATIVVSNSYADRLLGSSQMIDVYNTAVWLMTGNNPTLSSEISRRCIRVRIDPKMDQPWKRTGFKHENPEGYALEHRAELITAILTLVQYWISQGAKRSRKSLGSFEEWAAIIGGILEACGVIGFLDNLDAMYDEADMDGQSLRLFVAKWYEKFGETHHSMTELMQLADDNCLLDEVMGEGAPRTRLTKLTNFIRENKDRTIGTLVIQRIADSFKLTQTKPILKKANIEEMREVHESRVEAAEEPRQSSVVMARSASVLDLDDSNLFNDEE